MIKKNSQGFMLAETLIVASFITITLIFLFIQIRNVNNNYSETLNYNSVNGLYIDNEIKKFILQYDVEQISYDLAYNGTGYYDLTSCDASIFIDSDYCEAFFAKLNVNKAIYTLEKVNLVNSNFSSEFIAYLNSIHNPDSNMYIIATEYNDKTYSSIKLNGFDYPTIENLLGNKVITSGSGLYQMSNGDLVFRGNEAELANNISLFNYNGKIISVTSEGVKVLLKLNQNVKFDNTTSFYTNDSYLSGGAYLATSSTNSLLFSSLNINLEDELIVYDASWDVGYITTVIGNSLTNIINSEKATIYKGKNSGGYIGTLSVSDIIKATINSSCNQNNISSACLSNNWLAKNSWTFNSMNTTTVWSIVSGAFTNSSISSTNNGYAVIYIDKTFEFKGEGTETNPYKSI